MSRRMRKEVYLVYLALSCFCLSLGLQLPTQKTQAPGVVGAILCGCSFDRGLFFRDEYLPGYGSGMYPDPCYGSEDWALWYTTFSVTASATSSSRGSGDWSLWYCAWAC